MNYKDWILLKTISEEHNLTRTAERLFISQPALSYRLHNLEKFFDVKILNRHSHGVYFTPQGEYLLKYAEEMLDRLEQTKEHVRNIDPALSGTLRLGVSSVIAKIKLAPLLKKFKKKFPDVKISLTTGSSTLELPVMLKKEQIDIAIVRGNLSWPEEEHLIAEEPMCIVYFQPINFKQLPELPWINYHASSVTRSEEQLTLWWQENFGAAKPNQVMVDSIEACIQMVSHGLGWCIIPKIHIENRRSLFSCPVVFRDGHILMQKTRMLYGFSTAEQPLCKAFIDHVLREY